ncbi:hypothetical protein Fleli_0792 [Bernardetia litoralis DSM 6794]|uniref:Uncharacterized protein n=1 Tax=Bernardetia litoralis (strain ATCC 23117 / DSM 6794 / NBRC 15988 / NCIMB 1366 / Fx l1 / Sio-4) TaxID=880071 RepID=I4AH16_BERLS|nr:hypothetical protein [Bernardetia litoralis]AFM03251.1 hypothetical protein Fleli_0792 [Bernardetia litoralis DSM 6794]
MKQSLLFLLIFVLGTNLAVAQVSKESKCGTRKMTDEEKQTLPWYGNNQYLYKTTNL